MGCFLSVLPPTVPDTNPTNVRSDSSDPKTLVITWDVSTWTCVHVHKVVCVHMHDVFEKNKVHNLSKVIKIGVNAHYLSAS